MSRAPFQILVFPYRRLTTGVLEYAIFHRADLGVWQGIAGGGEDDETPEAAAMREAHEEAGIPLSAPLTRLATVGSISVEHFRDRDSWDSALHTIPEYAFGVDTNGNALALSREHTDVRWVEFETAVTALEWESNRTALRELHDRLS